MKLGEGTSSEIKTIGELKENNVFVINNKNEHLITLNKNQVIINSKSLNDEHNKFLIDTGADLNIIKLAAVKDFVPINMKSISLQGIHETPIKTLGTINITLTITEHDYKTTFQVVSDKFPTTMSGILGIPFFRDNDVTLNLKKGEMIMKTDIDNKYNKISIPPRSNNVLQIPLHKENANNKEIIIDKQNITDNVWIGNSISTCINNTIYASVLNLSEINIEIDTIKIDDVNWEIYEESSTIKSNKDNIDDTAVSIKYFESEERSDTEIKFSDRNKIIADQLITDHLNIEELKVLTDICYEYSDIFFVKGDKIVGTDLVVHRIITPPNQTPINIRQYRLAEQQKLEINKQISELEQQQVIKKSTSPWNHPLILVPKKIGRDGEQKFRLCVDFRKLNQITEGNS